ncbi:MAG: hypothetical protein PX636_13065 [Microcystis sp. M53598_WE2]|nr:hypothetical protein [Microcystis sp. M53598_WE2]
MARLNQSSVVGRQKISFIDSPHTPHPTPHSGAPFSGQMLKSITKIVRR